MTYRIGVDIGGTFTDFALFDDARGRQAVHKHLTTPDDPSRAVLEGIQELLAEHAVTAEQVATIVHGTTLVANALIERKGSVTGILATEGFTDVPDIGRETRYDVFDLRLAFPAPLVPRVRRVGIPGRIAFDGSVTRPLDLDRVRAAVRHLIEVEGIEALAVCFLHAYANPAHERQVGELLARENPGLHVSLSSEVSPFIREFDRWTTTMANAYVQPMIDCYLSRLADGLASLGFAGRFLIMSSNGGTVSPGLARRQPIRLLESGPAAGALMAARHGRTLGIDEELSFDMGGTTAKGALVSHGLPLKRFDLEIARVHQFKRGSGLPIRIPVIDMIEIGAGGGSLAEVDSRGVIRVGPQSAGAEPGPVCYGRGGTRPTLTDANLVLGYLDPQFFLGGRMALDRAGAVRALETDLARPLSVDVMRAAWGVHETINEDVARAFRTHAAERGFDYRRCSMLAFGGSGPIHAMRIARKLKVARVVFPVAAGVMSAFGLLVSPLTFETARTHRRPLSALSVETFAETFERLAGQVSRPLVEAGVPAEDITITRRLDMRYVGQGHDIEVALPDGRPEEVLPQIPALFAAAYAAVFAISFPGEAVEIVNWKAHASAPEPAFDQPLEAPTGRSADEALKRARNAYFPLTGGVVECPVYDRYALRAGMSVAGPALIEERESTAVLDVGDRALVDARLNLVAELTAEA